MISEKGKKLLANNIKKYRKERGLTQNELGEMVDLTGVAIMRYEKAQREPKLETIEAIASALGVNGIDLLGWEYWDLKNPNIGKEVREYEGFWDYLKSLDYIIKDIDPIGDEDGIIDCSYEISGNGLNGVILSSKEYKQMQSSSSDLIYSFLWKKLQK